MSEPTPAQIIATLIEYAPRVGGAYIAALRAAGYDDAAIGDDYLTHVRDEKHPVRWLVAMVRRAREVEEQ